MIREKEEKGSLMSVLDTLKIYRQIVKLNSKRNSNKFIIGNILSYTIEMRPPKSNIFYHLINRNQLFQI